MKKKTKQKKTKKVEEDSCDGFDYAFSPPIPFNKDWKEKPIYKKLTLVCEGPPICFTDEEGNLYVLEKNNEKGPYMTASLKGTYVLSKKAVEYEYKEIKEDGTD